MSVLVKGMKMPQNCYECPLCYDGMECLALQRNLDVEDEENSPLEYQRMEDCPLIEVTD